VETFTVHGVGHDDELIAPLHDTRLRLAHHDRAHVLVLVQDGHAERRVGVPVERLEVVERLEE
jgi:hypothetical protein